MLREELEFKIRMRNSLRGIEDLDPDGVADRLIELEAEILALQHRLKRDEAQGSMEVIPIGGGIRAA